MSTKDNRQDDSSYFSLNLGGPLYQFYLITRLATKTLGLHKRRLLIICLLAWLPLLLLTMFSGTAFSGVQVPFIFDIDVHTRLLGSLSLLVFAEVITHRQINTVVQQFTHRDLILVEDRPKFNDIITSTMRLRNSFVVEILLIIFVYTVGHWISIRYIALNASTWYASRLNTSITVTPAGYWYAYISLPLFQFILVRWYFRVAIWYRFLWQVSKLRLQLNSLHPDRAGGLGFLTNSIYAFEPLLLAHTILFSGMILNRMMNAGATLHEFQTEIIGVIVLLLFIPLIPTLFFIRTLTRTKRSGTLEYGTVANRYVNNFRKKWIDTDLKNNEAMLGTSDIQSLADLSNSFEVSNQMRVTPFNQRVIFTLIIVTALPLAPLILTIIPFEKIILNVIKVIF